MNINLTKASEYLRIAAVWAEDGAVLTAIERSQKALACLIRERDRRIKIGLLPKTYAKARGAA